MTSFRLVLLSAIFLPSLWAEQGLDSSAQLGKRLTINMMDPLTRRSALDKNFVRFGRSRMGMGVNRSSRARPDSFLRFGRGYNNENEDILNFDEILSDRDIQGKTDFIRSGRGKDDTDNGVIRTGRGKHDNFLRFGRGRQDNFIRYGQNFDDSFEPLSENNVFYRVTRGGSGKSNTNFVRFGKRDPENDEEIINAYKNGLNLNFDPLRNEHLPRIARLSNKNKGDSFIRFGRSSTFDEDYPKKFITPFRELNSLGNKLQNNPLGSELVQTFSEINSNSDLESDLDATKTLSPSRHESTDNFIPYETSIHDLNRKKRSTSNDNNNNNKRPTSTDLPDLAAFYNYPAQLVEGLPNFIIGPELSVLPAHAKPRNSRKILENKDFIRLG